MNNPTQPPHDSGSGEREARAEYALRRLVQDVPFPVEYQSFGGCTCAGPDGPCEACIANEEAHNEWLTEPSISPREAAEYGLACARAALATPSQAPAPIPISECASALLNPTEFSQERRRLLAKRVQDFATAIDASRYNEDADPEFYRREMLAPPPSQAVASALQATAVPALTAWLPMESAPTDGTSVLLLIEGGEHPLQDDDPSVSIGSFGTEGGPVEDPTWNFAGWCWHQDCYCRGTGTPIGWMPHATAAPAHPVVQPGIQGGEQYALSKEEQGVLKGALLKSATILPEHQAGASLLLACDSTCRSGLLREPRPDDLLTVANIEQDGNTLTLLADDLSSLVNIVGEAENTYTLRIAAMRRDEFEELGEFDGF